MAATRGGPAAAAACMMGGAEVGWCWSERCGGREPVQRQGNQVTPVAPFQTAEEQGSPLKLLLGLAKASRNIHSPLARYFPCCPGTELETG